MKLCFILHTNFRHSVKNCDNSAQTKIQITYINLKQTGFEVKILVALVFFRVYKRFVANDTFLKTLFLTLLHVFKHWGSQVHVYLAYRHIGIIQNGLVIYSYNVHISCYCINAF